MKHKLISLRPVAFGVLRMFTLVWIAAIEPAAGQNTAFTYQGRLTAGGGPANGVYDFSFQAFDALTGGSSIGGTVNVIGVGVTNGLFTALVDLGGTPFSGPARWLQRGTLNVVGSAIAVPVMTLSDSRAGGRQYSFYGGLSGVGTLDVFDQTAAANRLTIDPAGNIGIGTPTPQAKLEVRGDVRLGPNGELSATGSEVNLRIVRGRISAAGGLHAGSGFSVSHPVTGFYQISFIRRFAGKPAVTVTVEVDSSVEKKFATVSNPIFDDSVYVMVHDVSTGNDVDADFSFIAIGLR